MISRWPNAYPDEMLYSVVARSGKHRRVRQHRTLVAQLFGYRKARAQIELPGRLHHLSTKIPGKYFGEPRNIAEELTMLPLYQPFIRRELGEKLLENMIGATNEFARIPALHTVQHVRAKALRFCPRCWEEQEANPKMAERYWSRSHQAAGCLVCELHEEALWESPVSISYRPSLQRYYDASDVNLGDCRALPVLRSALLIEMARSLRWLLNENDYCPGTVVLQAAYFDALSAQGFAQGSTVRMNEVRAQVVRSVSIEALDLLESGFGQGGFDWLGSMLRRSRTQCTSQPAFRHVLLMKAFGHTPATFFAAMQRPSLLETTLAGTMLVETSSPKRDQSDDIRRWWTDPTLSVNEMARRLEVDAQTVNLIAARLGLPIPRFGKWGNRIGSGKGNREEVCFHRREQFLALRRAKPHLGLKGLAASKPGVVRWLRRHDWKWLQENRPVRQLRGGAPGVDWEDRDKMVVRQLPAIVGRLKSATQKVTVSAIERELGIRISNMRKKLPRTNLSLRRVCG